MTIALYSIIFGLIAIVFIQAFLHRIERKELHNRILGGRNKKPNTKGIKKPLKTAESIAIDKWQNLYKSR